MTHPYEPAAQIADDLVNGAERIDDKSWQYGYDRAIADTQARINESYQDGYADGFATGRKSSGMVSGDAVRDLIDAAVLAEREACGLEMQKLQDKCPDTHSGQTMLMAYAYAETAIRARTTNTEIAKPPRKDAAVGNPPPDTKGADDRVELLLQRVIVLEYALLDVANQARPLREWGGNVAQVMTEARKNGWDGTGK